jgi:hypothetical protein
VHSIQLLSLRQRVQSSSLIEKIDDQEIGLSARFLVYLRAGYSPRSKPANENLCFEVGKES